MSKLLIRKRLLVSAMVVLFFSGCGLLSRRVQVGEEFTLRPKEKVVVAGTDIGIQLNVVGHQWYVDNRADTPYAELTVTGGGAPSRSLTLSESANVGDYAIKLVAANPFNDRGGPDCKLVVTRH